VWWKLTVLVDAAVLCGVPSAGGSPVLVEVVLVKITVFRRGGVAAGGQVEVR